MSNTTYTSTAMARPPRANLGLNSVTVACGTGGTVSLSTTGVFLLCKIPPRATILDVYGFASSGAASATTAVGIDDTLSAFIQGLAINTIGRQTVTTNFGYTVSMSDDAAQRYSILKAQVIAGTTTAAVEVKFTVLYTMDV